MGIIVLITVCPKPLRTIIGWLDRRILVTLEDWSGGCDPCFSFSSYREVM